MDLTSEQVASSDVLTWVLLKQIRLQSGDVYTLVGHEYMKRPMMSKCRKKAAMKATGMGFSEGMGILPSLHGLRYGRYKQGVLYLFPTNDDVQDFSKSRFASLIANNRASIGQFVKSGGTGTDTARLKKVGNSYLYLRGATLSPEDEGGGGTKSTKLSGIQVDRVVFDELAQMNIEAISKAVGRMQHSEIKEEVYIANPGGEDEDIDLVMQQTNQMYWHRRCGCGTWTCAELEFPQCVRLYPDEDERRRSGRKRGYIACSKCGKEVSVWNGLGSSEWVAKNTGIVDFEGYNLSHLSSAFVDPADVLDHFNNPPHGNLGDVIRLELGKAYSSKEDKLQRQMVLQLCGREIMPDRHNGPCAMGVDVGIVFHVVIGTRTGKDTFEIIRVAQAKCWEEVESLGKRYGVKNEVDDIRPYEDSARNHQKLMRNDGIRVFLSQYVESPLREADFNDNTGIVKVYRTGIFDKSHRYIVDGKFTLPRQSPAIEEFARQCCNCAKHKEEVRGGGIVYRYVKTGTGEDHYRNALNYFLLAAEGCHTKIVSSSGYRKPLATKCIHETVRI